MIEDKDAVIHIHLSGNEYVRPGEIHLLAAYADYKELEFFLAKHFKTAQYTRDKLGFPEQLFVCQKGSVFVRNVDGSLKRD